MMMAKLKVTHYEKVVESDLEKHDSVTLARTRLGGR
jgi:hypothetical protein